MNIVGLIGVLLMGISIGMFIGLYLAKVVTP